MNDREPKLFKIWSHVFMLCSALPVVLFFFGPASALDIADALLAVGAKSIELSFLIAVSSSMPLWANLIGFVWLITFPVLLTVAYIRAFRKNLSFFP